MRITGNEEEVKKAEELIKDLAVEKTFGYNAPKSYEPDYSAPKENEPEGTVVDSELAAFDWQALSQNCVRMKCILFEI